MLVEDGRVLAGAILPASPNRDLTQAIADSALGVRLERRKVELDVDVVAPHRATSALDDVVQQRARHRHLGLEPFGCRLDVDLHEPHHCSFSVGEDLDGVRVGEYPGRDPHAAATAARGGPS